MIPNKFVEKIQTFLHVFTQLSDWQSNMLLHIPSVLILFLSLLRGSQLMSSKGGQRDWWGTLSQEISCFLGTFHIWFVWDVLTYEPTKKYRKAVRWCASLNRSLSWLIRFIWIGLLDFWVDWIDLVYLIDWLNGWI